MNFYVYYGFCVGFVVVILSDAFERDVALADAKTRASFLFFFQNVRELGDHATQNAEIRFGVVMHRRVRENEFKTRFGGGFLREAVGEEVLDVVLVVVHVVVSGNERREILFGGFESDGVGVEHGEFDFLLRLFVSESVA